MQKNKIKNHGLSVARLPSSMGYPNLKILWLNLIPKNINIGPKPYLIIKL
jgi:hypothetical protein